MSIVFDIINFAATIIFSILGTILTITQMKLEKHEREKAEAEMLAKEQKEKALEIFLTKGDVVDNINQTCDRLNRTVDKMQHVVNMAPSNFALLGAQETFEEIGEAALASHNFDINMQKLYLYLITHEDDLPSSYERYIVEFEKEWNKREHYKLKEGLEEYIELFNLFAEKYGDAENTPEKMEQANVVYREFIELAKKVNEEVNYVRNVCRLVEIMKLKAGNEKEL